MANPNIRRKDASNVEKYICGGGHAWNVGVDGESAEENMSTKRAKRQAQLANEAGDRSRHEKARKVVRPMTAAQRLRKTRGDNR